MFLLEYKPIKMEPFPGHLPKYFDQVISSFAAIVRSDS